MKPQRLRKFAATGMQWCAVMAAATGVCDAQTWHWGYVTRTPNSPPITAQSSVIIAAHDLHLAYTVPLAHHQVVIESCTADVRDVENVTAMQTAGTSYLLVQFKPSHDAACANGKRPAVALPANDESELLAVAAAINHSCCGGTSRAAVALVVTPSPYPSVAHSPSPQSSSSPQAGTSPKPDLLPESNASATPSAAPDAGRPAVQDWVETDGAFWFVRVRNVGRVSVTPAGDVVDCHNVDTGCGSFARVVLDPGGVATVATITSRSSDVAPTFGYRYTVAANGQTVELAGESVKRAPRGVRRMTAGELRLAQRAALDEARAPRNTPVPTVPARLVKRGSSRLSIGQTGIAVVRVTIGADGSPENATIVSTTNRRLAAAAIETAVSSVYAPAVQSGHPVTADYVATFSFDGVDPALSAVPVWKRPASAPAPPTAQPAAAAATTPSPPEGNVEAMPTPPFPATSPSP
jgi:hypothetical protein